MDFNAGGTAGTAHQARPGSAPADCHQQIQNERFPGSQAVTPPHHPAKREEYDFTSAEAMRLLKEQEVEADQIYFSPDNLAKLIFLVDNGTINRTVAKEVFEQIFLNDVEPETYVEAKGLRVVNDAGALKAEIQEILDANPQSVVDYHNDKERAMGFLVGQTMRAMKEKA